MRGRLSSATQTLAGAAAMITLVTVASRLLGFGRWVAQAGEVGSGGIAAPYAAANVLPNVVFEVAAGGALAGVVVPLLVAPLVRAARDEASRIASALLTWTLLVLVPLAVLAAATAPLVARALPGLDDVSSERAAAYFLVVFAVQVPLYGVGVVLSGVLQAHRRFFWPAAAPMLSSVVVIGTYLLFGHLVRGQGTGTSDVPSAAVAVLAWGTTAGVVAMSLPLLVPVHRAGVRLRPTLRFPPGVGRRARDLALAGIGALTAQQVAVVAVLVGAGRSGGDQAFNVYQYSQAVYVLPYAILAVPLATSAFPRLADRAEAGDPAGFARLAAGSTRVVLVVGAVGAAALVAAGTAVESAFGTFTTGGGAEGMAQSVTWAAPGLLGFGLVFLLSRALYALDRGRTAVLGAASGWLLVAVLSVVAPHVATSGGQDLGATLVALGLASSAGMLLAGVLLVVGLHRHAGADATRGVARTTAVVVVAGIAGGALGRAVVDVVLPARGGMIDSVLAGALGAVVATCVVVGAVWALDRSIVTVVRGGARDRS
ncbi:murein biosynthesis integral membrane protein MurJ [Sanguibacter suaedae]|uniref:Virulence factor MviN n=1 Tax=Sanguibacter suaedae TaxID=2795737 RepID=A0A934I6L6_9MICO|nr:lipid II flippase MurJ [Sanguibacter suaedae]MBI9116268.1 virulence factor MviN [Sanguibacter suaedae]